MKKFIALILIAVYTISGTGLREMVKLPVLVQHFIEHRQLNAQITFTGFLVDHYNSIPHTDNDEDRDNQLPFKQVNVNVMFAPVIPASGFISLKKPVIPIVSKTYLRNVQFIPSAGVSRIWQPPKSGISTIV